MRVRLQRCREERGSVLPLVAVLMLGMMGMAAFVLDLGNWYVAHRQVQSAADAAALAAVQDLPSSSSSAVTDANTYVSNNISGATATVTTPYSGDSSEISVTVTKNVPSIFAGLLGVTSENVTATAVAKASSTGSASAFYANDTSCSNAGITINGNNNSITSGIHSNSGFSQIGNNNSFGATTYGGPNSCSDTLSGVHDTYASGPTLDTTTYSWPQDFSTSPPTCTYSASSFTWNSNNVTLPSGVYCATGAITVNGNSVSGNVTFIANSFSLIGNNLSLTPYTQGLLFYQTGTSPLTINGNNLANATIFAPHAAVTLNGNNASSSGFIEALDVTVNGNNFSFTGTGAALSGSGNYALVQ